MMEDNGYLIYVLFDFNLEFLKWFNVDISEMFFIYILFNKVYLFRMKDDIMVVICLVSYMNVVGIKGYMIFDYIYLYEL